MNSKWEKAENDRTDPLADYETPQQALEVLGLIISYPARQEKDITVVGRSCFFNTGLNADYTNLHGKEAILRIVRGFCQSVRPADKKFLVNVNASHAVFYPAVHLDRLIRNSSLYMESGEDGTSFELLAQRLTGVRVEYTTGGRSTFKTITGLGKRAQEQYFKLRARKDTNGNITNLNGKLKEVFGPQFQDREEIPITVYDYFECRECIATFTLR